MMNDSSSHCHHHQSRREIAIRSLRRRLWRAFQQEDEATAIRAYTATRADYVAWIQQEEQERSRPTPNSKKFKVAKQRRHKKNTQSPPPQQQEWEEHDDDTPLLQTEMNPSDVFVSDDFKSPNDAYPDVITTTTTTNTASRNTCKKMPKFAGFWTLLEPSQHPTTSTPENQHAAAAASYATATATTPLHEAARMASPTLVRLFLQNEKCSPNVKNGREQTSLIVAAGGLTRVEANVLQQQQQQQVMDNVGIRACTSTMDTMTKRRNKGDENSAAGAKKAALAVVRLFRGNYKEDEEEESSSSSPMEIPPPLDAKTCQTLEAQRMDVVLLILSWSWSSSSPTNQDGGGGGRQRQGPSMNSVDARGRTALHYAAELGRTGICTAIVSNFGALLTIVDESSRTPCELAGEAHHAQLAAQLEARALLYADPYGVDDELMATVLSENRAHGHYLLTMPFAWFETWSTVQVRQERLARREKALVDMQQILAEREEQNRTNQVIYNYNANDSIDSTDETDIGIGVLLPDDEKEVSEPTIHMLAGIHDDDHPPSPPCERADSETEKTNAANQSVPAKGATDEDNVVDSNREASKEATMDDESSAVDSDFMRLLKSVQESHVERYLTVHHWDSEKAMAEFEKDPMQAFSDAGVSVENKAGPASLKWEETPQTCLICFETFDPDSSEWTRFRGCGHGFCTQCMGDYIADCAQSRGGGMTVTCPHHECDVPLTQSELESLAPSPTVYESLLEAADENFVASSCDLKFCPHPGCEGIVHRLVPPIVKQESFPLDITDICGAVCVSFPEGADDAPLTYEGVRDCRYVMTRGSLQPHKAHRFCFACGDETIHWPVTCETLEQWKSKIRDEVGEVKEEEEEGEANYEDVAQRLWMKANTRPCPKCKVPIEKNEGCNHMTCTNRHCRHEFCWICRKDWKLHNTETGGFFRCNRWEGEENHEFYDGEEHEPRPRPESEDDTEGNEGNNDHDYGSAVHASRVAFKKKTEMKRFLHHFSRWSAHKESAALEQNMADTACSRLDPVVEAAVEFNGSAHFDFGGKGLSFIHAAFTELLECRSLLQHSYAFAFFRYPTLYYIRRNRVVKLRQREKATFEQFQSELEMMTEQMSDIVARTHLRATQTQIMFLTSEAAEKRRDFSSFLIAVLNDERKEKAAKERQERESENPNQAVPAASIPPPLDISGIIERLQSRTPLTNVHNDMDSDDGIGVSYPRASLLEQRLDEDHDLEHDTAMQEALRASLVTFNAESGTSFGATSSRDVVDDGESSGTEWACEACTFVNSRGTSCEMCGAAKNDQDMESESDLSSMSDDGAERGEEEQSSNELI